MTAESLSVPPQLRNFWVKQDFYQIYKDEDAGNSDLVKNVEIRLGRPGVRRIRLDDIIRFNDDPTCERVVDRISLFRSFDDIVKKINPSRIDPTRTPEDLLEYGHGLYSPGEVALYGLVAIELKPKNK
ncbi:MAG TPA: hypothetical protein VG965_06990 [Patescibacteria group bacterium]|nr:hypothetical protein [Patescibacteria group bacterium]